MENNAALMGNQQMQSGALTSVEEQRAQHEVQSAMVIAKRFPRDIKVALDRILNSCTRKTLAESALYTYARGGTDITGPSIRLAETIAQQWGNLNYGIREISQKDGVSTVEAFCWDLETNVRQTKVFQVEHKRHTRKGGYALTDPRDIYELVANNGARRLRACILGVIPADITEDAVRQCETTITSNADTSAEAQKALLAAFEEFGVSKDQVEERLQRRMDAITPAQVVSLRKIYRSLKDGMGKPADWFTVVPDVPAMKEKQDPTSTEGLDEFMEQPAAESLDTEDDKGLFAEGGTE